MSPSESLLKAVEESGLAPLLITPKYYPTLDLDCVYVDEQRGVAMAVEHLLRHGYRKIGFLSEDKTSGRLDVFRETMKSFHVDVDERFISAGPERGEHGGFLRMNSILHGKEHPDAIVAGYDQMAIGAIQAIEKHHLRVPEDIAVVGFDDSTVASYIKNGLTTIRNPCEDMMRIAVRVLLGRMEQPDRAPQQIALRPTLIVRRST